MRLACFTGEEHLRIAVSISVTQDPHKVGNGCEFGMKKHVLTWQKRQLDVSEGGCGHLSSCSTEVVRMGMVVSRCGDTQRHAIV